MKTTFLLAALALIGLAKGQDPRYTQFGITQDKQKHYASAAVISGMTYITAVDQYRARGDKDAVLKANIWAFSVGMGASILKEGYDFAAHKKNGTWNSAAVKDMKGDLVASALGALTVTLIVKIF